MRGCFCIELIDFMLAGETLTDCTSLFSPYDFENNDNTILSTSLFSPYDFENNDNTILSYFKKERMQFH